MATRSAALPIVLVLTALAPLGAQAPKKKAKAASKPPVVEAPAPPKETDLDLAKKVADKFILGVQSASLPEGKAMLKDTSFPDIDMPVLLDQKTVIEAMFDTDIPQVQGFRRLLQVKVQSKAGTELSKQYILIAYKEISSSTWKVWEFREAGDALANAAYFKDIIDRKDYKYTNRSVELMHWAYWLILGGKLAEARQAYADYKESSKTDDVKGAFQTKYGGSIAKFETIVPAVK